jgi:hypothetical protein
MDFIAQLFGQIMALAIIPLIGYLILKGAKSTWRKVLGWLILSVGLLGAFASIIVPFFR